MYSLLLALMTVLPTPGGAGAEVVRVAARPSPVLIGRSDAGQLVNCDFLIENTGAEAVRIERIEVSAYDPGGRLLVRKFIGDNGVSPGIDTLPKAEIAAGGSLYIFNPLYAFRADAELHELRFRFTFGTAGARGKHVTEVRVNPVLYETRAELTLPLKGRVFVWDGLDYYAHPRRLDLLFPILSRLGLKSNFARYAYDLCAVNAEGDMYRGSGERNEDWFGLAMPLLAPGAGRVVKAEGDLPDQVLGQTAFEYDESFFSNPELNNGNYVIIDHGNGEFSKLAHIMRGSLKVKVGERVRRGQVLGKLGNSGDSLFPHVHYELRRGSAFDSEGLPSYFSNFRRHLGSKTLAVKRGQIETGEIVESR